jgi:hypothetical protein
MQSRSRTERVAAAITVNQAVEWALTSPVRAHTITITTATTTTTTDFTVLASRPARCAVSDAEMSEAGSYSPEIGEDWAEQRFAKVGNTL